MARVFIAVGSNIDPAENVRRAVNQLGRKVRIVAISTFYLTEAQGQAPKPVAGRAGQPPFYNGVVEVETEIPPARLKDSVLRRIEEELGRQRTADEYAARTMDLDVILYDDEVMAAEDLVIPDPQIEHRPFLAIPLYELAPDLVLPGSRLRIREIAAGLSSHKMEPLPDYTELLRKEIEDGS